MSRRFAAASCVAYLVLALAYAWPLPLRLSTGIAHDAIDPLLNTLVLDWTATRLPLSGGWWDVPVFAPMHGTLAMSEHLLGLWPFSAPLLAVGVAPVTVYNLLLIASFVLSAMSATLLVTGLTNSRAAGLVAGCLFGFAPYRLVQLAHLQILANWWGPVALLALHRQAEVGGWRWAVTFAGSWLLLSLTSGYHLVFFSIVAAMAGAWLFVRRGAARRAVPLLVTTACAGLVVLPLLLGYARVHRHEGLTRQPGEIDEYAADLAHYARRPALSRLWGGAYSDYEEVALFPGIALVAGVGLAIAEWRRRGGEEPDRSTGAQDGGAQADGAQDGGAQDGGAQGGGAQGDRRSWTLPLGIAAVALVPLALATVAAFAPGRYGLAGVGFSLTRPAKSLTVAWVLLTLAAVMSPPGRRLWQQRSLVTLYSLIAIATWLFTLGPRARVGGVTVLHHAPYGWLMALPGGLAMRVAPRFWLWTVLALAVVIGLAVAALQRRSPRAGLVVASVLGVLAVADGWPRVMPVAALPLAGPAMARSQPTSRPWIELPLGASDRDMAAMWRGHGMGRPVVNGYSGYDPTHYRLLERGLKDAEPNLLPVLAEREGLVIAVDTRADGSAELVRLVQGDSGVAAGQDGGWDLYVLESRPLAVARPGRRLAPQRVLALADGEDVTTDLIDAQDATHWSTDDAQRPGDGLVAEWSAPIDVAAIALGQGARALEYPFHLRVEAWVDEQWRPVFDGRTAPAALRAALRAPRSPVVEVAFEPVRTRRIRLVAAAGHHESPWSVSSLAAIVP